MRQAALDFNSEKLLVPGVRGGKGLGLARMTQLGICVPPGFTIHSGIGRAYSQERRFPKRLAWHVVQAIRKLELGTGRTFGRGARPLLVSVRSGAAVSMPGMMDTLLNLGLNDQTVEALAKETGDRGFALDCYLRLLTSYAGLVLGVSQEKYGAGTRDPALLEVRINLCKKVLGNLGKPFPQDPWDQLSGAIRVVFDSWNSQRAVAYRSASGICSWQGSACTVQAMVFGNLGETSATGVVFSANPSTGKPGLFGEFLPNAQGEDVVSGASQPLQIGEMRSWNAPVFDELVCTTLKLEEQAKDMVDVEFTVERGKLYILQVRPAKRTQMAQVTSLVTRHWRGFLTKKEVLMMAAPLVGKLRETRFGSTAGHPVFATGLPASPGCVFGRIARCKADITNNQYSGYRSILVKEDTSPDDFPEMSQSAAIVTVVGGLTCHAAVVARGFSVPAVVGCEKFFLEGKEVSLREACYGAGRIPISVDGANGIVYLGRVELTRPVDLTRNREYSLLLGWAAKSGHGIPTLAWEVLEERVSACGWLGNFYMLEKMVLQISNGPMLGYATEIKRAEEQRISSRMAAYLFVAIAGELRHIRMRAVAAVNTGIAQGFVDLLGASDTTRADAQTNAVCVFKKAKHGLVIKFLEDAEKVFYDKCWPSSSFGGAKWGQIARVLLSFLKKEVTTPVFIDQVFDIQHNGGHVFDKHSCLAETDQNQLKSLLNWKKKDKGGVKAALDYLRGRVAVSDFIIELFKKGEKEGIWS